MPKQEKREIESLNIDNLDVEELEQRLELAVAGVDGDCWTHENCTSFLYDPPVEDP